MKRAGRDMVNINGEKFKKDVLKGASGKMGLTLRDISTKILRRNSAFITQSCDAGRFEKNSFETLCTMLGLDEDDYFIKEETPEEVKTDDATDVIVGLNSLYNLLNTLLAEQKTTNTILQEIVRRSDTENKMVETINSNTNKTLDKLCQIYTDIHYNMKF